MASKYANTGPVLVTFLRRRGAWSSVGRERTAGNQGWGTPAWVTHRGVRFRLHAILELRGLSYPPAASEAAPEGGGFLGRSQFCFQPEESLPPNSGFVVNFRLGFYHCCSHPVKSLSIFKETRFSLLSTKNSSSFFLGWGPGLWVYCVTLFYALKKVWHTEGCILIVKNPSWGFSCARM